MTTVRMEEEIRLVMTNRRALLGHHGKGRRRIEGEAHHPRQIIHHSHHLDREGVPGRLPRRHTVRRHNPRGRRRSHVDLNRR